jgi:hypothetical protein
MNAGARTFNQKRTGGRGLIRIQSSSGREAVGLVSISVLKVGS